MPRGVKGSAMSIEDRRAKKCAYMVQWRKDHPEYHTGWWRRHYGPNANRYKIYARRGMLKMKYGLTEADYDKMFVAQDGKCAICGCLPKKTRLAVDHSHITGQVRSLLCGTCNCKLGVLEDKSFRDKAAEYLLKHGTSL